MTHTPICHLPFFGGRMGGGFCMTYIKPSIESLQAECSEIIAVSIISGASADNSEVLSKENNDWDMWGEE